MSFCRSKSAPAFTGVPSCSFWSLTASFTVCKGEGSRAETRHSRRSRPEGVVGVTGLNLRPFRPQASRVPRFALGILARRAGRLRVCPSESMASAPVVTQLITQFPPGG